MRATRRSARSQARKNLSSPSSQAPVPRKLRGSAPSQQSDEEQEADSKGGGASNDDVNSPCADKMVRPAIPPPQSRSRRRRGSPGVAPSEQGASSTARRSRRRNSNEPTDELPSDVGEPDTVDDVVPMLPLHAEIRSGKSGCVGDMAGDTANVAAEDMTESNAEVMPFMDATGATAMIVDVAGEDPEPEALSNPKVEETDTESQQDDPSSKEASRLDQSDHHEAAIRNVAMPDVTDIDDTGARQNPPTTSTVRNEAEEPTKEELTIGKGLEDSRTSLKDRLLAAEKEAIFNLLDFSHSQVAASSPDASNEDEIVSPPDECHFDRTAIVEEAVEASAAPDSNIESITMNEELSCVQGTPEASSIEGNVIPAVEAVVDPAGAQIEKKSKIISEVATATEFAVAQNSAHVVSDATSLLRIELDTKKESAMAPVPAVASMNAEDVSNEDAVSTGTVEAEALDKVKVLITTSLDLADPSREPPAKSDVLAKNLFTVATEIESAIVEPSRDTNGEVETNRVPGSVDETILSQEEIPEAHRSDLAVADSVEPVLGQGEPIERKEINDVAAGEMQDFIIIGGATILEGNDNSMREERNEDADMQNGLGEDEAILDATASRSHIELAGPENSTGAWSSPCEGNGATPSLIAAGSHAKGMQPRDSDAVQGEGDVSMIQGSATSRVTGGTVNESNEENRLITKGDGATFEHMPQNGTANGIVQEENAVLTLENAELSSFEAPALIRSDPSPSRDPSADLSLSNPDVGDPILKPSQETPCQTGRTFARREKGVSKPQASVQAIKVHIYTTGVIAHKGKGAEKLFASYWGALCRCFGTRNHGDGPDKRAWMLKGSREVIKKFLTTKKLRRLHNSLILGLLHRCVDDTASADDIAAHIPSRWRNRVHVMQKDVARRCVTMDNQDFETAIQYDFRRQSSLWTSGGVTEQLLTVPENVSRSLCLGAGAQTDDYSPPLPGALLVDPYVRLAAQREGLKVSENAVWLVVVGMREYVKSLLKDTLATMDSVSEVNEPRRGSALVDAIGRVSKASDISSKDKISSITKLSGKRKRVSALDVAACLMSSPLTRGQGANRLAFENCYLSALDVHPVTSRRGFESIQSYVASGIDISSVKRPRVQNDSHFQPPETTPRENVAEATAILNEPDVQASRLSEKLGIIAAPRPTQARRSPNIKGMGRGAKNLEALKARAAAAASAAKNDPQATGGSSLSQQTVAMNDNAELVQPSVMKPTGNIKPTVEIPLLPVPRPDASQASLPSNPAQRFPTQRTGLPPPAETSVAELADGRALAVGKPGPTNIVAALPSGHATSIPLILRQPDMTAVPAASYVSTKPVEEQPNKRSSSTENLSSFADGTREGGSVQESDYHTATVREDTLITQRPVVRGQGFGVKNLAMMRARSVGAAGDSKDERTDAEEITHSDELSRPGKSLAVRTQGKGNELKAEGAHGNTEEEVVLASLEASKASFEQTSAIEPDFKPSLDKRPDGEEHGKCDNESVTNAGIYQQVSIDEAVASTSDNVAQLSEQGKPLAYKA